MDSFGDDDLSTAFGTETLAGREMVPEGTVSSIARSIMGCMTNIGAASTVSNAKKLIAPEKNALADTTVKATECLKA
jgi:hypothetical protein